MKKLLVGGLVLVVVTLVSIAAPYKSVEDTYQYDADIVRIEDVMYWSELIEEYKDTVGRYPLEDQVLNPDEIILVRVATKQQQSFFDKNSSSYVAKLDNNRTGLFTERPVKEFVKILEEGLGRDIDEHYDIQKIPTKSPNWYNYFISEDGYLFWVSCVTCEINWATTLLADGYTPTINVGSAGVTAGSKKMHTRAEMLALPDYIALTKRELNKEDYVRSLQQEYFDETKTY